MENVRASTDGDFDAIVIGAGVVGCAVARKLAIEGARVLVLEKGSDILEGASKGNSALLHTGFDAPAGSLEQQCIADGYRTYREIRERLALPILECGALVVAWNDDEAGKLDAIVNQAHANGVRDARIIDAGEVHRREPGIGGGVAGAVLVPGESIIDPWSTPFAYLLQALLNGAGVQRRCEVTGGEYDGDRWCIDTTGGRYRGACVINCAGLYGDVVNRMLLDRPLFEIRPRKGEFLVYDKPAAQLVNAIILPVPTERSKGVVVCRTIFGNLLVGPTAREQDSRDDASVDSSVLAGLMQRGARIVPALASHQITATYAGIRPATEAKDYRIHAQLDPPFVSVGGIRSTGLSGALGIANLVYAKVAGRLGKPRPPASVAWPRANGLSAYDTRDWQRPGNGGIVCHCEWVTRRDIVRALDGPLAARSLGGLKRRTRATMGRCQGFYCTATLVELTAGRFDQPLDAGVVE